MLLKEFEHSPAIIEPFGHGQVEEFGVCDTLIFSFNGEIVDRVRQIPESREGGYLKSLNGRHPWYLLEKDGLEVAVMMAGIGAPLAVGHLEELKSSGLKILSSWVLAGYWIPPLLQIRFSCQRLPCGMRGLATITPLSAMKSAMSLLCF